MRPIRGPRVALLLFLLVLRAFVVKYLSMLPQWIIEKKRDGKSLADEEIRFFIKGYTNGTIPDYQMSALAMAVYFRGMNSAELATLTDSMMRSGDIMNLSSIKKIKADKHSTGGIGDKVSLVLAPLIACCGLAVPMISGRGLGITGGTLDKLESIPGYRTNLSPAEFISVLRKCGCSLIGQTDRLAPADRKLYALRDVTATVPSIPLISASIMSKKLAEGADILVLDVKYGRGAFMKTPGQAEELARTMIAIGKQMGRKMSALLTDMNQPLGRTAGNALEIIETVEALQGKGPADLMEVTIALASRMLILAGTVSSENQAAKLLSGHIKSGAAFAKFKEMVKLHGGNPAALDDTSKLPAAPIREIVPARENGYVTDVNAETIGRACIVLGAGRKQVSDTIDHAVGIAGIVKISEHVQKGQALMTLHAADRKTLGEARQMALAAVRIGRNKIAPPPLILKILK
jgi:pyrimidine-nucleoside phosphorylase